jgi:ATP-binding cassette, subfamily F, member 3
MVQISNVDKSYSSQVLFEGVNFAIGSNERIGVLGRNGYGKSTLFKMILGEEHPDNGTISIPKGYSIGHLSQRIQQTCTSVLQEACLGLPEEERATPYRAERILEGLGFDKSMMTLDPNALSGGYQLRLELTKLLLAEPNLLLLDEPTNYLDLPSVRWLQRELTSWAGELLLITHDREFMDSVSTHTIAINRRKIKKCDGGSRKMFELLAEEESIHEKTRENLTKRKQEIEAFAARFRAQASKAKMVQSRLRELDRLDIKEELREDPTLAFRFNNLEFTAKRIAEVTDLSFSYDSTLTLIENLSFTVEKDDRIGIIGKNGRGKSTLLRLLVGELSPSEGSLRYHDKVVHGYLGQSNVERLNDTLTVEDEISSSNPLLGRTAIRAICGAMMFGGSTAEKYVRVLSGGERNRVMLGKILAQPSNLIFLDEPTNHLDMESIDSLISAVQAFSGAVIFVTHSELMLRQLAKKLLVFTSKGIELFQGTYDEFCEQRGFDEEGALNTKPARLRDGRSSQETPKEKKRREREKKKLAARFEEISSEIKTLETKIQQASQARDTINLITFARQKEEFEAEQLKLLEVLEG